MSTIAVRRVIPGLLVGLLALVIPALGQEVQPTPRGERIIEAFLIWRLVDELDLNEGQIARIFPRIKALKNIRIEMGRRVPPLRREIRQLTAQAPRDDEAIRIKVTEFNQLRLEMDARRRRQLQLIAAALTSEQLGKFTLIQETFEVETLRLLEDMRRIVEEQSPPRR
ncbi:MAG: Spy/CpxP family protein refolding chaperone [Armatimonadota bacterium]